MKTYLVAVILLLLSTTIQAQWVHEDLTTNPTLDTAYNNKYSFQADVTGFFKNNEYFNPFVKGATFPGMRFIPKFGYQIDNKFRFEIGSSGLYYSGDQQSFGKRLFNAIHARMQYDIYPNLNFVLGNYYGGVNHRLIEPLYRWERHFVDSPESGLQIIYHNKKYFADVWLNWQRYIEKGDPQQEVLTFGFSSSVKLTPETSNYSISIPFQLVINHKGGQIDISNEKNLVIANATTGIKMKYNINHSFFDAVGLDLYAAGYYDKNKDKETRPFDKGWGIYPVLSVDALSFKFMMGYWQARKFYSMEGESLFSSFHTDYAGLLLATRRIITNKFSYTHSLLKGLSLGVQAELYSDLNRKEIDYSFGIHVRFDLTGVKWQW